MWEMGKVRVREERRETYLHPMIAGHIYEHVFLLPPLRLTRCDEPSPTQYRSGKCQKQGSLLEN